MNLKEYVKYVDYLAQSNSPETYLNSGKDHAIVVLSTLFKHSKKYIYIYAGDFNKGISASVSYKDNLFKFLNNGGELKILLQHYNPDYEPELFKMLRLSKMIGGNIEIKKHSMVVSDSESNEEIHFAISDDKAYRIEYDTSHFLANGCFNDNAKTLALKDVFYKIFDSGRSKAIKLI